MIQVQSTVPNSRFSDPSKFEISMTSARNDNAPRSPTTLWGDLASRSKKEFTAGCGVISPRRFLSSLSSLMDSRSEKFTRLISLHDAHDDDELAPDRSSSTNDAPVAHTGLASAHGVQAIIWSQSVASLDELASAFPTIPRSIVESVHAAHPSCEDASEILLRMCASGQSRL